MAQMASGAVAQEPGAEPDGEPMELVPPDRWGRVFASKTMRAQGYLTIQGKVARGEVNGLFDDVVGIGKFVLFSREKLQPALSAQASEILETIGGVAVSLDDIEDVDGTYGRWLDHLNVAAVLIRPDFYVFGTAQRPEEVSALIIELAHQLKLPQAAVAA